MELAFGFDLSVRLHSDNTAIRSAAAKIDFISITFLSKMSRAIGLYAKDAGKSIRIQNTESVSLGIVLIATGSSDMNLLLSPFKSCGRFRTELPG